MLRRSLIGALALLAAALAPAAVADEPLQKGFEGSFSLQGTHGYDIEALIGSTGTEGTLALFVGGPGGGVIYRARGAVTKESVDFDLGPLGRIEAQVEPNGKTESLHSGCDGNGKATTIPAGDYVGTIEFHGEEGFTDAEAATTPLLISPLDELACGGSLSEVREGGSRGRGVGVSAPSEDGIKLTLDQNRPGARVFYRAHAAELREGIRISRTVTGYLGGAGFRSHSDLSAARFSGSAPFSGNASYVGSPQKGGPGHGTWRGSLEVDFPGRRGVRLAGPEFAAKIFRASINSPH